MENWVLIEHVIHVSNPRPSRHLLQLNRTWLSFGTERGISLGEYTGLYKTGVCHFLTHVSNMSSGRRRRRVGLKKKKRDSLSRDYHGRHQDATTHTLKLTPHPAGSH